ncbi:MAG: hypothetical protein ABI338_03285 [Gemmatimonadaceae bacterium]
MQILVQGLRSKGGSLREAIATGKRIDRFSLAVSFSRRGTPPHLGW